MGREDLLIKSFREEGPNTVFPSVRERAHQQCHQFFAPQHQSRQFFNKAIYSALWLVASPQVTR